MNIELNSSSDLPPYAQVRQQIQEQVMSGELPPGSRLPSVRQLAIELNLAANTVARAYRELEQSGVLVTRGRNGTIVPDSASASLSTQRARLQTAAEKYLVAAGELGIDPSDALEGLRRAINLRPQPA